MSSGLEALHHPRIKSAKVDISAEGKHDIAYMFFDDTKQYTAIEKELKDYDTIKARLTLVEMKIKARREECMDIVVNTDEDSYINDMNLTRVRELDWLRELLKEVLKDE